MKNKEIRNLIFFLLSLGAVLAITYLFRPTSDCVCNEKSEFVLPALQLMEEYEADETIANNNYLGKTITVQGKVASVLKDGQGNILVEFESQSMGVVSCTMCRKGSISENLKEGKSISIKGECVGFTFDVVLVKCCLE